MDITLVPPSDDSGGLDANDLAQMQGLSNVKHIRVRVNKGVRLLAPCGTEPYFRHLGRLGRPLKTDDPLSGVLKLSLYSPIPQPLNHCFWLASTFPNIRHLILDNILSLQGPVPPLSLPNLASFKLRNPVNIKIDARNGFSFLADLPKLENLALRGCDFDVKFLQHVLQSLRKTLKTLELATKPLESCPDRCELLEAQQRGARSLETGWHVPIQVLGDPARVGDIAALICSEVTTLALGGPLSISPKLLQILSQHCRKPLRVLALHDVGPLRPTRPDDHPEAAMEKELIQQNSSGISPQDVLHAFKDGFHIPRLELRGMGHEWQEPTAQVVKEECIRRGISLIS